jgi:hypothetical protein
MQTSCDGIIENFDGGNAEGAAVGKPTKGERRARTPLFGRGPTATEAALLNCNKARRLR